MPNKTIYLDTIKNFEESAGLPLLNGDEMAQKLQEAWRKDTTQAKLDYLATYREIFLGALKKWSDSELSIALKTRSESMANFKKCLLKTDEALKVCAMSLIPELRENADVLSNMTFGVMDTATLKKEFTIVRRKYLGVKEPEKIMKKRREDAYNKYKKEWQNTTTRKIVELVRDQEALRLMSREEKTDYALALESYRNDPKPDFPLDSKAKGLMDDALAAWKEELGFDKNNPIYEGVAGQYFEYTQKIQNNEWIDNEINAAIAEFNATPNPAKQEIEKYKELVEVTAELKRTSEKTVRTEITEEAAEAVGEFFQAEEEAQIARKRAKEEARTFTDDKAEMVGDFFMQEELTQEIAEAPLRKERVFLQEKAESFNREYSLTVNHHKLRTSVEELSALMIKAHEEKQRFISKSSVVVIENGKETCYEAKDYYKESIAEAHKAYVKEIQKIEEERQRAEQDNKTLLGNLDKQVEILGKDEIARVKADHEKEFKQKSKGFDGAIAKAKEDLQKELASFEGGIVIEKDGNTLRQYSSSRYYETHETQKEQYVYGEYQQMFSRAYKDACHNVKEQNYQKGKVTDFSKIAKDVDDLFKSAMYVSNVYDNDKNLEIVQKCSFGGLSVEQLASFAAAVEGDSWAIDQSSETVWSKQVTNAKKILTQWNQQAKEDKKIKPCDIVKGTLDERLKDFNNGKITRKEMLDYTLAADSHLQTNFPTRAARFFSRLQYNRERKALQECRAALGLMENDSLRVAMNNEYTKLSNQMSKEQIFKSVEAKLDYSFGFEKEKTALEKEHQIVQDRETAKKVQALESLKAADREPISIPEIDERKAILNQKPRVEPIVPTTQLQRDLSINQ